MSLPGGFDHEGDACCPACRRFIGPIDRCPYCGGDAPKRPFIRRLRLAAYLLAFGGLAALYAMVIQRELPVVRIGSIDGMMNFAYVRVVGKVVRDAYVREGQGGVDYLSFLVDDASGRLRVQVSRDEARKLVDAGCVPQAGTLVDVAGSLAVSAEGPPRMRVQSATQLALLTVQAEVETGAR